MCISCPAHPTCCAIEFEWKLHQARSWSAFWRLLYSKGTKGCRLFVSSRIVIQGKVRRRICWQLLEPPLWARLASLPFYTSFFKRSLHLPLDDLISLCTPESLPGKHNAYRDTVALSPLRQLTDFSQLTLSLLHLIVDLSGPRYSVCIVCSISSQRPASPWAEKQSSSETGGCVSVGQ